MSYSFEALEGLRVVRGPNWKHDNKHGYEGLVGTVVNVLRWKWDGRYAKTVISVMSKMLPQSNARGIVPEKQTCTLTVIWDCGETYEYRIDERPELRVFDNSSLGIKHHKICCTNCNIEEIYGFRWQCVECLSNFCTWCFTNERHTTSHINWRRFDSPTSSPVNVKLNYKEPKVTLRGIFPGSRVERGPDWYYGNEDGGSYGEVLSTTTPGKMKVKWYGNKETYVYRVGHHGKVDLCAEKAVVGGYYYPETLPILTSTYWEECQTALLKKKQNASTLNDRTLAVKDKVKLSADADLLREMQDGHGGWDPDMRKCAGADGVVEKVTQNGVDVYFPRLEQRWTFNPETLKRLAPFSIGEIVRVRDDEGTTRKVKLEFGEKVAENLIGQVGRVVKISDDGSDVHLLIQKENKIEKRILESRLIDSVSVNGVNQKLSELQLAVSKMLIEATSEESSPLVKLLLSNFLFEIDATVGENGVSALHMASRGGSYKTVKLLLESGASLELEDDNGNRPIHHAVIGNHVEVLKILISKKACLDCKNHYKKTPYHLAACEWFTECLEVLITDGRINVNAQDVEGNTALHLAIQKSGFNLDEDDSYIRPVIEKMISVPSIKLSLQNKQGRSVLHTAAETGNLCVVRCLLDSKGESILLDELLSVEFRPKGPTALYLACEAGHYQVVKCLLEFINKIQEDNFNQLQPYQPNRKCASLIRTKRKCYLPLVGAIERDHYAIIELLVGSRTIVIDASDSNGDTAIGMAAKRVGFALKLPDSTAPTILTIYQHLKLRLDEKAEPALAVVLFLMKHGAKMDQQVTQHIKDKKIISTLFQFSKNSFSPLSISGGKRDQERPLPVPVVRTEHRQITVNPVEINESELPSARNVTNGSSPPNSSSLIILANYAAELDNLESSRTSNSDRQIVPFEEFSPPTIRRSVNILRSTSGISTTRSHQLVASSQPEPVWQIEERSEYRGANRTYVKDGLGNTYSQKKGVNVFQCTANVDRNGKKKKCRATVKVEGGEGEEKKFRILTNHEEHSRKDFKRQRMSETISTQSD